MEFIHKSNSTVGYRQSVFSTTLFHLIATNSSHLIVPFIPVRERLKETVEEFFGCEYELFIEFTGLISWAKGASIGWHSDDNRSYLKQRDFTAVCYLNSYGEDFKGGLFHFQDGEPKTLIPTAGDAAIYTADSFNIHSVDEVIEGERLTLTLWFSRDSNHDEDTKLISRLSEKCLLSSTKLPMPASCSMYWFCSDWGSLQQSGFDIRCVRICALGFDICSSQGLNSFLDATEVLTESIQLARGNELYETEFSNVLHALQAVQFYYWKASGMSNSKLDGQTGKNRVTKLSKIQQERVRALKNLVVKDSDLANGLFSCINYNNWHEHDSFDWSKFSIAIAALGEYTCKLHKELMRSLPFWRTQKILFCVDYSFKSP